MKKLLLLSLLLLSFSALADIESGGDGTLPVIKTINVKFTDGPLVTLPKDVKITVNKALKVNESVTKELNVKSIELEQDITLKNVSGDLDISVKSNKMIKANIPMQQMQKQISAEELVSEIALLDGVITQEVSVTYVK